MMEQAEELCDFLLLINKGEKVIDGTLDSIRKQYKSNMVTVELEDDAGFVDGLPMVAGTGAAGARLEVTLKAEADTQDFLQALAARARVRVFEVKSPSLHEIFINLVEGQK
jgi:ABC-2 type transport system ATP-binding protein